MYKLRLWGFEEPKLMTGGGWRLTSPQDDEVDPLIARVANLAIWPEHTTTKTHLRLTAFEMRELALALAQMADTCDPSTADLVDDLKARMVELLRDTKEDRE